MMPDQEDNRERDPLSAYVDGDLDAVRAAAPHEPGEAEWEDVRRRIHARLNSGNTPLPRPRRVPLWLAAGAVLTASAAALAWVAFNVPAPKNISNGWPRWRLYTAAPK